MSCSGHVTSPELGAAVLDEAMTVATAAAVPNHAGMPAWAVVMQQGLQQLQQLQQQMQQGLQQLLQGQLQMAARLANRDAIDQPDVLRPLPDAAGAIPPNFPATRGALEMMPRAAASLLCQANGLPAPANANAGELRATIRRHIGMRF